MTALDAYRDVLRELDSFNSAALGIKKFNFFFQGAVSQYIAENYQRFDVLGKDTDDIQSIVVRRYPKTITNNELALPIDYRHLLYIKVKIKFVTAVGKYAVNDTKIVPTERMPSAEEGFRELNAYGAPSHKRIYYQIAGGKLYFEAGSKVTFPSEVNAWLNYVKIPPVVYLNPTTSSGYDDPSNNSVLFFNTASERNHIYYEIVNLCARNLMDNTKNPRLQQATQLRSMKAE